ncbi:MAG: flagellar biosynthetic protein FliR, partial [Armatimonadetes bacterium]|nr:flagellar biosynthetic protein FliR [Armatimonadota bacterium]
MNELSLGLLVCIARILPPVLLMPPLSWWGMPFWLRLGIGLVVGLAAAPMAGCSVSPGGAEMLADDLAAGLAMALIVSLPFWALQVAGTFTQTVAGWADEEHGRLPEAFFLFGLAVVAAAHGHSWIAAGLVKSCAAWPGVHNPAVQAHVIASASEMLGAAVLIAIPMLAICGVAHV